MMKQSIGVDVGFGGIKIAFHNGQEIKAHHLPSVVGAGEIRNSKLSTGLGRSKRYSLPMQVQFEDKSYLVGHNVHQYTNPVERLDYDRLSDGPEQQALMYASLYQCVGDGDHSIDLIVALPVEVLDNEKMSEKTLRQLRGGLLGEHEYMVDGEIVSLEINQVKGIAQPMGTFFNWGMDEGGRWVQSIPPTAKVAICDIGFNTVDLFCIENKRVNQRYSAGDKLGIRNALTFISNTAKQRHGVNLSLYEADKYLRRYLQKKSTILHHQQGDIDIKPLIDQAISTTYGKIASFLENRWGDGHQFKRILCTGGGSLALRSQLINLYPAAIISSAITANAIGLAKYIQVSKKTK